ncbi:MAG: hypothetical protein KDB21_17785, partial [Acidimicrobiales bacterium]|nr:hypothetical protein [Acidimicrobiales bacterium]
MNSPDIATTANLLTARWASELRADENAVVSGASALGLLAMLLAGADGDAENELANATALRRSNAAEAASALIRTINGSRGTCAGMGVWVGSDLEIRPEFRLLLPEAVIDTIPLDTAALDGWASNVTNGTIDHFPATPTAETLLLAATVIAADADWRAPFTEGLGHWSSDPAWIGWLHRTDTDLDQASLLSRDGTTVSRMVCETAASFDVHLIAGSATDSPGTVLGLAVDSLTGAVQVTPASDLRVGDRGGVLMVAKTPAWESRPHLNVDFPVFDITTTHDLLATATLFGLEAATDRSRGHFPRLSDSPLAIEQASQSATASVSALGFRAA